MNIQKLFQKTVLILACILLANGCTSSEKSPSQNKQQKDISQTQERVKKKTPPNFFACHPPNGDLSPDGNIFVSLTPDALTLNVTNIGKEHKQSLISLPWPARDVILLSSKKALLSLGPTGEVALVDLKKGQVGKPVKTGESTAGMCRTSEGRVLVADPDAGRIYLFDPQAGSAARIFPVAGKPQQMRWVTQDFKIEAADAKGHSLGTIDITQKSQPETKGNR